MARLTFDLMNDQPMVLGSLSNVRFADFHAESVADAITRGAL